MADIQLSPDKKKRRLQPPRIDLTPMVDLGFLLISFFMYTTTLTESKAMEINQPYSPPPPGVTTSFIDTSTVTLIPVHGHLIVYYEGAFDRSKLVLTSKAKLRDIIIQKQRALAALPASFSERARKIQVLIKPSEASTYEDVVYVLDEMLINNIDYYAMVDITTEERNSIDKKFASHHDN